MTAGTDYDLKVTLKSNTVSVYPNGNVVLSYVINALVVDGGFCLLSRDGSSSFDLVTIQTDDPGFPKV